MSAGPRHPPPAGEHVHLGRLYWASQNLNRRLVHLERALTLLVVAMTLQAASTVLLLIRLGIVEGMLR